MHVLLDLFRGLGSVRTARVVCTERDGGPRVTTPTSSLRSPSARGCSRSPGPEEILTVEQVAQILQVIPDTVRAWIQSGALRASRPGNGARPGRKYRVRRGDLDAFIAASQRLPALSDQAAE
ncbi:MAG TPA: helix-turn-helix domain-containing protein [Polyangia bacterium]|nr:helix-turn-helix domain-containing protein [Polyangia bacterium]